MADIIDRLNQALAGRYAVSREIGAGGMATVYQARDLKHDRDVAIKVLRQELARVIGADRFDREIRISAKLQHPNILTLIDSGDADGLLYYVMPYVEGESLRHRVSAAGALPIDEAVRYLRDIVDALATAHRNGVVHRDIKPENVLLSERHALVMDFGVAKAVQSAREGPQLTTAGLSLGTPTYMAPEQAAGDPDVDHRADLYAVGVLAYEILTGRPPFEGATAQAVMAAHIMEEPVPITERRAEVPRALAAAVTRCLAKDREDRWQSAADLLAELDTAPTPGGGVASVDQPGWRSPRGIAVSLMVGAVILVLGFWGFKAARQASDLRWAREEAVPEIERLLERDQHFDAWLLAQRVEDRVPGDPVIDELWPRISYVTDIHSDPPGAVVRIANLEADTARWVELGETPLARVRVPRTYMRVRMERDGYVPFAGASLPWRFPETYVLDSIGTVPEGMVRVPGGETYVELPGLDHLDPLVLASYFIDRYEVTNRQYKVFVDRGGYTSPEYWTHRFELDGRTLSFEQGMARFVDATGRPGPSTWEGGGYPEGQDDYPVAGLSWYEAAAYAHFVNKSLPTIYHWARAADTWASAWIVPRSNLSGERMAPVGAFTGMGPYGTFDMAGNVREWCANAVGSERYVLGGGWNDRSYQFNDAYAQSPFDRSSTNGIRLVRYVEDEAAQLAARAITREFRDFRTLRPVSDQVFAIYRRLFDYDPTPLNVEIEAVDTSATDWIRERVAFDAAYGERMFGYLFLPKRGEAPYQTVVYFPGSGAIHTRSSEDLSGVRLFDFILRGGRAVFHPVYKSTFERGDSLRSDYADESNFYKEHVVAWVKDFRRSVDYLETRPDIDTGRLAYFGVSWGGYLGGLVPALEPRLKASVLYVAGLEFQRGQPEVEPLNYLPRITIPVLMLNGEYDHFFPKETSQRPMFELLGTPAEHKRWVVYEGGHFVPRAQLISETLDWLDRYLGEVR